MPAPTKTTLRRLEALLKSAQTASHYELLGVSVGSILQGRTDADLARRELALQLHPDRHADNRTATLVMAAVNAAHTTLTTKALHDRYRATLAHGHEVCPTCRGQGELRRMKGFTSVTYSICGKCQGSGLVPRPVKPKRK